MRITRTIDVKPTVEELAECFAELDGPSQARFFIHFNRIAREWEETAAATMQAFYIGKELRDETDTVCLLEDILSAAKDRTPSPTGDAE